MKYLPAFLLMLSAPVLAQTVPQTVTPASTLPVPPPGVGIGVVNVGALTDPINGTTTMRNSTDKANIQISGCDEDWVTGEEFYIAGRKGSTMFLLKRSRFDSAYAVTNKSWDGALYIVGKAGKVCQLIGFKAVP